PDQELNDSVVSSPTPGGVQAVGLVIRALGAPAGGPPTCSASWAGSAGTPQIVTSTLRIASAWEVSSESIEIAYSPSLRTRALRCTTTPPALNANAAGT